MNVGFSPQAFNLELTTCCPLHCPQCYCTLTGGKHLKLETAKQKLDEAAANGVKVVHLSGGETMCYPHLFEVVEYALRRNIKPNVALSGYGLDAAAAESLRQAGVNGIFLSLNGSTEAVNSLSRDGYALAINALRLLKKTKCPNIYINWVMHSDNCFDFENMLTLAQDYNVGGLAVLVFKPDSRHQLKSYPTGEQIIELAKSIKAYKGPVKIAVESCFSQLRALLCDTKLFGNLNVGPLMGCRAGIYTYSVSVDGRYSPCRHLEFYEDYDSLTDYAQNSPVLAKLRISEKKAPCLGCLYSDYCRPCFAVNAKLHKELYIGNEFCSLSKSIKE